MPAPRPSGTSPAPHVLLAPDKFKGSLGAAQVVRQLAAGLRRARPGLSVTGLPVADGGEGTVDALVHCGFRRREVTVGGPTGRAVRACYAQRGDTVVVELAQSSGPYWRPDSTDCSPSWGRPWGRGPHASRCCRARGPPAAAVSAPWSAWARRGAGPAAVPRAGVVRDRR
ncbi:glycerate kinase [Embleya sp. NPDC001921]